MCHDEGKAKSLNANGGKASPQVTSKGSGNAVGAEERAGSQVHLH